MNLDDKRINRVKMTNKKTEHNNWSVFTSETVRIESGLKRRVAGLVGVNIHSVHSRFSASTLSSGVADGITDAAIREPACAAPVVTSSPGGVELSGGGQHGVELLAFGSSFVVGETLSRHNVENLSCGKNEEDDVNERVLCIFLHLLVSPVSWQPLKPCAYTVQPFSLSTVKIC